MKWIRYGLGVLLAVLWIAPLRGQEPTGSIRGHVTDATAQKPIQGVTITVGSHSTTSRADGSFLLAGVPAGDDTLRTRMIGYSAAAVPVSVPPGELVDVDVALTAQALNLAEMVVVGYGEQQAGNITGAVTSISAEEFNKGRIVSPAELIQNKVPGVQVVENNEPGGGTAIRIRGTTSINASSEPLYVVDGLPLGTGAGTGISGGRDPLNFINSDDIESIVVLRDASAAAIYGANAANGVVLITTKRGNRGGGTHGPVVEYSGTVSGSYVTRLPTMLSASQFRTAVATYAPGKLADVRPANTDWFKVIDRPAYGQEQNVAISGAGQSSDYRLSVNYLDQDGIIEATNTKRVTLGISYNQRLASDRLNLRFNVRGSRADDHFTPGGVLSNATQMAPTQPVRDRTTETGFYDWPDYPSPDNPAAILALAKDQSTTYRSIGNLQAGYSLPWINGLSVNTNFGYDVTKADRETFTPSVLHAQLHSDHGTQSRNNPTQANTVFEGYLDYLTPHNLGPGSLDVIGGYSYSKSHSEFPFFQALNLSSDGLGNGGIPGGSTVFQNRLTVNESKLISFYARANYNVNDKYLLAASVRRDGSSRFGKGNDWGTFPSLAVGWRLSAEPFMRGITTLSDLKLRASWAKTGNQSFADYQQYSVYVGGDAQTQYQLGDTVFTTERPSAVDPNIKWESTRSYDIGLDFGFSNQRFTGAIDVYDKKTSDMIFKVPVPAFTNLSNFVTTNIGSMRNRGIELNLSAQILQGTQTGQGLRWTADFTAAHNHNELLTITPFGGSGLKILTGGIAGGVGTNIEVLTPGEAVNSFYVFKQKYANGKPLEGQYEDLNGDGVINQSDLRPFHDPAPKWILGHSSYLAYGKFDFGATFRAYLGNYIYNNVASNSGSYLTVSNGNGSPYNAHSSVLKTGFLTPQYQSDYYVEDGSFLRLDNLTVGYTFGLRGASARVFGTLQNVFTVTGYSGVDPSANVAPGVGTDAINGIDNNIYPRSRTFTAGLSLKL